MPQITVNTGMDTRPIVAGSKEMKQAVQSLKQAVSETDKMLRTSLTGYVDAVQRNISASRDFANELTRLETMAADLRAKLSDTKEESLAYQILQKDINKVTESLKKLKQQRSELESQSTVTESTEYLNLAKQYEEANKKLKAARQAEQKAKGGAGYAKYQADAEAQEKNVQAIEARMEKMVASDPVIKKIKSVSDKIRFEQKELSQYQKQAEQMRTDGTAFVDSKSVNEQMSTLVALNEKIQQMKAAAAETPQFKMDSARQLGKELARLYDRFLQLNNESEEWNTKLSQTQQPISEDDAFDQLIERKRQEAQELDDMLNDLDQQIDNIEAERDRVQSAGGNDAYVASLNASIHDLLAEYNNMIDEYNNLQDQIQGTASVVPDEEYTNAISANADYQELVSVAEEATQDANTAQESIMELLQELQQSPSDVQLEAYNSAVESLQAKLESWQAARDQIANSEDVDGSELEEYDQRIEVLVTALNRLNSVREHVMAQIEQGNENTVTSYDDLTGSAKRFYDAIQKEGRGGKAEEGLEKELAKTQTAYDNLIDKQQQFVNSGGDVSSPAYKKLQQEVDQTANHLAQLKYVKEQALKAPDLSGWNAMPTLSGTITKAFQNIQNAAQVAGHAMQHPVEAFDRAVPALLTGLANVAQAAFRVALSFGKMVGQTVLSALQRLGTYALNAATGLAKMAGSAVISFLKQLASAARNAATQLAKITGNALSTGLKGLGSVIATAGKQLLGLGKSAKRSNGGLASALKMVVRYGLGVRSTYMLVRKLRSALTEAFQNMAKQVPEVNKSLSALVSSLDLLKNSLATAFQPILTVVTPILVNLMDTVSGAMNKVGEFFAVLTGQNYIYKATKAQIDYAASLDKTKKKAKEAENQLAGFDHLNILKDNKSDDTEDPTATFEKVPVKAANSLAEQLKKLFNSGDFAGIGKLLADKLWEIIDGIDFGAVGKKIGEWINNIVNALNGFFDNFPWEDLGAKLGEAFMNIIETVDPYELGRLLVQKIRVIILTLWGFVQKLDFVKIGTFIANALRGAFDNIPWETLAQLIATLFNGVLEAIYTAAELFPWGEAGERIANALRIMIMGIDIEKVYRAFRSVLIGILQFIIPILKDEATWNKIASDFSTFLNNFFQDDKLWALAREAIRLAMERVVGVLKTIAADFQWGENGTKFGENINKLVEDFPDDLGQVLSDLLAGALLFMGNVFGDGEIFNNLAMKLSGWVNDIFANDELWTNLGTTINKLLAGILTFGQTFLDEFKPDVAAENIKNALKQINWIGIAKSTWNLVKTAFSQAGSFVDALLSKSVDNANMSDDEVMYAMQFNEKSIGEKLGIRIREALKLIPWESIAKELWTAAKTAFNFAGDFLSSLLGVDTNGMDSTKRLEAIGNVLGEKLNSFANTVGSKLAGLDWNKILSVGFKVITDTISGFVNGLLSGEGGNGGEILLWVGAGLIALKTGILAKIASVGIGVALKGLITALGTTLETAMSAMASSIGTTALAVVDAVLVVYDVTELTNAANTYNEAFEAHKNETETMLGLYKQLYEEKGKDIADEWASTVLQLDTTSMGMDDAQKAIAEKVEGYWDDVPQNMWDGFSQGWNHYFGNESSGGGQGGGLGGLMVDAFSGAVDGVRNFLGINSPSKVFESMGRDTIAGYEVGVDGEAPNMENTVNNAFGRVVNATDTKWNEAANKQESALNKMDAGVSTSMNTMVDTATTGADNQSAPLYEKWGEAEYLTQVCLDDIKNDVTRYMGQYETETVNGMGSVKTAFGNAWNDIETGTRSGTDRMLNTLRSVNWADVGYNLTTGISNGINNNWNWLNDTVWNLAQSLYNSAKNALGIHSPSKLFKEGIGANIGLGIAEGILNTEPEVMNSVADLADIANTTMNDVALEGDMTANGTTLVDGLDGVLTTFSDKVQSSFTDMLTKLNAIAETVSFRTPKFAAGTVLPYSVAGKVGSADNSDVSESITASNEELISVIIQTVNNQTTALIRAIEQNSNNGTDRKINTDSIIDEINRRTRAMGKSPLLI